MKRILDQIITNYPSQTWLHEVADESFNDCETLSPLALPSPSLPAATESGRQVQLDAISQDDEQEVA
jgi:hypothetical protein